MNEPNALFSGKPVHDVVTDRNEKSNTEVDDVPENDLLYGDLKKWVNHIVSELSFRVPEVDWDGAKAQTLRFKIPREDIWGHIEEDGMRYVLEVPFCGDGKIFFMKPEAWSSRVPQRAFLFPGQLVFVVDLPDSRVEEQLSREVNKIRGDFNFYFQQVKQELEAFNNALSNTVRQRLEDARGRARRYQKIAEALPYKLKARADAKQAVPLKRKQVRIIARPSPARPEPDYVLEEAAYKAVLDTLRDMSLALERSPKTFARLGEEEIRDFFLVFLNGNFEGEATGETFNGSGKTDILVRMKEKNVFIGECKFWNGPAAFRKAINQLMDYATWRDTKTSILLFSKKKRFSSAIAQIPQVVQAHECFDDIIEKRSKSEYRFRLHRQDDPDQKLALTVLAFNILDPDAA